MNIDPKAYEVFERSCVPADALYEKIDFLERQLADEKAIVDHIWDLYGIPRFKDLNGRTIYDLVAESIRKANLWDAVFNWEADE